MHTRCQNILLLENKILEKWTFFREQNFTFRLIRCAAAMLRNWISSQMSLRHAIKWSYYEQSLLSWGGGVQMNPLYHAGSKLFHFLLNFMQELLYALFLLPSFALLLLLSLTKSLIYDWMNRAKKYVDLYVLCSQIYIFKNKSLIKCANPFLLKEGEFLRKKAL